MFLIPIKKSRRTRRESPKIRWKIKCRLLASNSKKGCHYCQSKAKLTVEHKVPLVLGGDNDTRNLTLACERCNDKKSQWESWVRDYHKLRRADALGFPDPSTVKQLTKWYRRLIARDGEKNMYLYTAIGGYLWEPDLVCV